MERIRNPWDRQEGESENAYFMFQNYLKLGSARRLRTIASLFYMSLDTVKKYSSRWHWSERVRQYETYLNYNHEHDTMEELKELEKQKYDAKISVSKVCKLLIEKYIPYLYQADSLSRNSSTVNGIKYVKEMLKLMKDLLKMCDFSYNIELERAEVFKEINFGRILKSGDIENIFKAEIENYTINFKDNEQPQLEEKSEPVPALDEMTRETLKELEKRCGESFDCT